MSIYKYLQEATTVGDFKDRLSPILYELSDLLRRIYLTIN